MDPVTLIVTALATGAAAALGDGAKSTVKAAYARLRLAVANRLHGRASGELVLQQHESAPDVWEQPLRAELAATNAAEDANLIAIAEELMALLDAAGAKAGKYAVTVRDSSGLQVGDRNIQVNHFGAAGGPHPPTLPRGGPDNS